MMTRAMTVTMLRIKSGACSLFRSFGLLTCLRNAAISMRRRPWCRTRRIMAAKAMTRMLPLDAIRALVRRLEYAFTAYASSELISCSAAVLQHSSRAPRDATPDRDTDDTPDEAAADAGTLIRLALLSLIVCVAQLTQRIRTRGPPRFRRSACRRRSRCRCRSRAPRAPACRAAPMSLAARKLLRPLHLAMARC